jgi:hypothetical protein
MILQAIQKYEWICIFIREFIKKRDRLIAKKPHNEKVGAKKA